MNVVSVLAPVFVQVALIFVLGFRLGLLRLAALKQGAARASDVALGEPNWPPAVLKTGNAFRNQFELPVLFILLVGLALQTDKADFLFIGLSWAFVVTRIIHAVIHCGGNDLRARLLAFGAGVLLLLLLWARFALQLFLVSGSP